MATWANLEIAEPELAAEGRRLFCQFGIGLGFLATVRRDGGPRLHPICPIITAGGLYAFIVPSPKCDDLRRDGRYALHSYPPEDVDDEFYVTESAAEVANPDVRQSVAAAYENTVHDNHVLFTFDIDRCLHAKYRHRGDWPPTYTWWVDPERGTGSTI